MPAERPSARKPSPSRRAAAPVNLKTGPDLAKFAPYVGAALVVLALAVLIRSPRFVLVGSLAIGLVVMAALGWVALSYRISLAPTDRLRGALTGVTLIALVAAAVPFAYTVYPPAPRGVVTLGNAGASQSVTLDGNAATVWLAVRGRFVPTATGTADYFLAVSRDDGPSQQVDGTLRPAPGGPRPDFKPLGAHGAGRYTVRLVSSSPGLALPVTVAVHAKPFSTLMLVVLYALIAVAVLAVDAMLWRRGLEPSFAAAMLLPLVAVAYFQSSPLPDPPSNALLLAAVIGAVGGGLGGELLARGARMFAPK